MKNIYGFVSVLLVGLAATAILSARANNEPQRAPWDPTRITIRTSTQELTDAHVATLVTSPLLEATRQLEGLKDVSSASTYGVSHVTLTFDPERSAPAAYQDVEETVAEVQTLLPEHAETPVVFQHESLKATMFDMLHLCFMLCSLLYALWIAFGRPSFPKPRSNGGEEGDEGDPPPSPLLPQDTPSSHLKKSDRLHASRSAGDSGPASPVLDGLPLPPCRTTCSLPTPRSTTRPCPVRPRA